MSKSNFSEEFKRDALRQITEGGYPVAEVSQRLDVSNAPTFLSPGVNTGIARTARSLSKIEPFL